MARKALVVGANGPGWVAKLSYAESDAAKFAQTLEQHCTFDVTVLPGTMRSSEIVEAVGALAVDSRPEDEILLFFAGHGLLERGDLFLILNGSERAKLITSAIRATYLMDALESARARNRVVVLDCCHAAAIGDRDDPIAAEFSLEVPPSNFVVFSAGAKLEKAREFESLDGGFFTWAINDLLSKPCNVTLDELRKHVQALAVKRNHEGSPEERVPVPHVRGTLQGNFVLRTGDGSAPPVELDTIILNDGVSSRSPCEVYEPLKWHANACITQKITVTVLVAAVVIGCGVYAALNSALGAPALIMFVLFVFVTTAIVTSSFRLRLMRERILLDWDQCLGEVGSSRVDLQACKLEYSIVSPK